MKCEPSQRLMALLRGERVDHPPLWEPWFGMQGMLAERYDNSEITMAQDLGHAAVRLGHVSVAPIFQAEIDPNIDTSMVYAGGTLRDMAQLKDLPEPDWDDAIEKLRAQRCAAADAGIACWLVLRWCFHYLATSMGLEAFAYACYDEPDAVREAMRWHEQRNREAIERVVRAIEPDFVLYDGDCAYKTGTMIDPGMMRGFCFDLLRDDVAAINELGIPVAYHTDGRLDDVIPMLVDAGICAVHGCEAQANDLAHLVDTFGDDIALCGNMDVVFLSSATSPQVRAATIDMLDIGSRKGRFIAGCNTSPLDYIPLDNYRRMARTIAAYRLP